MAIRPIVTVTLVAVALSQTAVAQECFITTSDPEVTLKPPFFSRTLYIMGDGAASCGRNCVSTPTLWVYEETNGMPGLQRHDFRHSDIHGCERYGDAASFADKIIF